VNACMWRVIYRELRAVTNDASLALNPMELNDIYDHLWDVATLLTSEDSLTILDEGFRPWPKIHHGSEASWDFYDIHERNKADDLKVLRVYEKREDVATYTVVLKEVFQLFGEAIKESLTRTMGSYLEATGGRQSNSTKTEWEKELTSRMICTNNPAESPFATARAYLDIYPSLKLRTLATNCAAVCNGNPDPNHKCTCNRFPNLNVTTKRYTPATTWR